MKNNYFFVRHWETYWNKNKRMHGQYDIPLNHKGIMQAKATGEALKNHTLDICFCSPLSRAYLTASYITKYHKGIVTVKDDRLKEISKGLLEGASTNKEIILEGEKREILEKYQVESKQAFFDRVSSFLSELEKEYTGKNILIVGHSGTIKMLYFYFHPPSIPIHQAYYLLHIKNGKLYTPETVHETFISLKYSMKIWFFPVVCDIMHSGHILAFEEAKKHCDYLIVGLHCLPTYKKPQQTIYERFIQIRGIKWVDEVVPYENIERDRNIFLSLGYDVYFLGADHKDEQWEMRKEIEGMWKEVHYIDRLHTYSSSIIKSNAKK